MMKDVIGLPTCLPPELLCLYLHDHTYVYSNFQHQIWLPADILTFLVCLCHISLLVHKQKDFFLAQEPARWTTVLCNRWRYLFLNVPRHRIIRRSLMLWCVARCQTIYLILSRSIVLRWQNLNTVHSGSHTCPNVLLKYWVFLLIRQPVVMTARILLTSTHFALENTCLGSFWLYSQTFLDLGQKMKNQHLKSERRPGKKRTKQSRVQMIWSTFRMVGVCRRGPQMAAKSNDFCHRKGKWFLKTDHDQNWQRGCVCVYVL